MDLAPYLDALRRDLAAAAAPGGPEVARAAELLAGALTPAARLCLLDVLSDAAAEITTNLETASVEVRLRDRGAELVVTEIPAVPPTPPPAAVISEPAGEPARITLRLPEVLKDGVERAAAADGISVNAWLVRAVSTALSGASTPPGRPARSTARRITGFAQA